MLSLWGRYDFCCWSGLATARKEAWRNHWVWGLWFWKDSVLEPSGVGGGGGGQIPDPSFHKVYIPNGYIMVHKTGQFPVSSWKRMSFVVSEQGRIKNNIPNICHVRQGKTLTIESHQPRSYESHKAKPRFADSLVRNQQWPITTWYQGVEVRNWKFNRSICLICTSYLVKIRSFSYLPHSMLPKGDIFKIEYEMEPTLPSPLSVSEYSEVESRSIMSCKVL